MMQNYKALPTHEVIGNQRIVDPQQHQDLTPDDAATSVMRDFRHKRPATISADLDVKEARSLMKSADVPLKLVINHRGEFLGLIGLKDILGKRVMAQAHAMGISQDDLQVSDIMHPASEFPSVHIRDLERMRVGDVVETFNRAHTEHFLVFEDDAQHPGTTCLCGLVSASVVARRLHIALDSRARARSFSDIVHAVHGHFE
ncbi:MULTISPECIES: CBS domain-containing protein [Marinobacter]|uniref:CBS domain-containing protein n=1 Tax=Marinobacter TaxID=2742 RepID=UPI000DAC72B0|nr:MULTISPECIES: CBS domain-containing protein [Marinobacter]